MKNSKKNAFFTIFMAFFLLLLFSVNIFSSKKDYSDSERRPLADKPAFLMENFINGSFTKDFETYSQDQFVLRDSFRRIKALAEHSLFMKKENNDYYVVNGYISKMEYPFSQPMQDHVVELFTSIYKQHLEPNQITPVFCMVPDKNYFLAEKNGYLGLDYAAFETSLLKQLPFMDTVDIKPLLSIEDYYYTDTHWKQENLEKVADALLSKLTSDYTNSTQTTKTFENTVTYTVNSIKEPFYGVYYHQAMLPAKADTLSFLTSQELSECIVTNYPYGAPKKASLYSEEKAFGKDPYEIFLCGTTPLITIENPNAATSQELIIFRDSFASSLAPLLTTGYAKITLVDLRYMNSSLLDSMVSFENADVLFLYSPLILNNSLSLK